MFKDCLETATDCNDPTDAPATPAPTNAPTPAPTPGPDNNNGLVCDPGQPCPSYFDDFNNLDGWDIQHVPNSYNNEYQFYTNRNKNVRAEDGYLKIRPFRPVLHFIF